MTVLYIFLAFMFGTWFGLGVYAFCNIAHEEDVEPDLPLGADGWGGKFFKKD